MEKNAVISFYLDTRRPKSTGLFPVKLRVYSPTLEKTRFYPTHFDFSEKEFNSVWGTTKPRNEFKQDRLKMLALEAKGNEVTSQLRIFSFIQFEKRLFRQRGDGSNLLYQYNEAISKLKINSQFGTAITYRLSLNSIVNFFIYETGKRPERFSFNDITPEWLTAFESYMIGKKQLSRTTVSIYLRTLRAIFNSAISEGEIDKEIYPFGVKKYQIPSVKNVKKALSAEDLKSLFNADPLTEEQEKAKDFWFFSYACNGMNVKDIALLKNENLQGDKIVFYRAKTINTSKTNLTPITAYLNEYTKKIINKYRNKTSHPKQFVFSIISDEMSSEVQFNRIKNFTRFINQNLKKLASAYKLTTDISTYWARHSFATNAIRKGASMEFVGEALNHKSMKTTMGYFAGFEENSKRKFVEDLMNFKY